MFCPKMLVAVFRDILYSAYFSTQGITTIIYIEIGGTGSIKIHLMWNYFISSNAFNPFVGYNLIQMKHDIY